MERTIRGFTALASLFIVAVQGCGVKIVQDGVAILPLYHWSSGYCLNVVPYQTDWYQARATCQEKNGELMVIKTEGEQTELVNALLSTTEIAKWSFWIGLFQVDSSVHDSYQWIDTTLSCSSRERRNCVQGTYSVTKLLCGFQKCCYDQSQSPPCSFPAVPARPITYEAWGRGSPTVTNDRMCVMMKNSISYQWVDLSCLESRAVQVGFICRFKENPTNEDKKPTAPSPKVYTATPSPASVEETASPNVTWIAIGVVCLLLLIILTSIIIVCCIRKKRRDRAGL